MHQRPSDRMLHNRAAKAVISLFNSLPAKSKPRLRDDVYEWVPLSGILVEDTSDQSLQVVSLATGNKVLPASKIGLAQGLVLHDCHAEILAIRGFNTFLMSECKRILTENQYTSQFVRRNDNMQKQQPFMLEDGLKVHMFSTEAPCGDASMEHIQSLQEDGTPWTVISNSQDVDSTGIASTGRMLRGRGFFSELGCVRTKPGRTDSLPTLSKSCSDKLATKQLLSLLQTPVFHLISPTPAAYLQSLILAPSSFNATSCERAFGLSGRLAPLSSSAPTAGGYEMIFFDVVACSSDAISEYKFSRKSTKTTALVSGSNIATIILPLTNPPYHETLINGVQQGRKAFSGKGASALSKHSMWQAAYEIGEMLEAAGTIENLLSTRSYEELKMKESEASGHDAAACRRIAKDAVRQVLAGDSWARNGGNDFGLCASI